jgi:uncharacterized protein
MSPPPVVRIVVFAKAPRPGLAKTRMIPVLGPQGAADLARRMLSEALAKALEAKLGPVELCVSPFEDAIWAELNISQSVIITNQGEGDLGERMARACARTLAGGEFVLLIGTDCPSCDASYLRSMAQALRTHDAVIAAAADGGYPAIGLSRFDPSVFQGVTWSTSTVLRVTLEKFRALQRTVQVFPELNDIDEPEDLKYLPTGWVEGKHTSP